MRLDCTFRKTCEICGKPANGKSHPKCSEERQRRKREADSKLITFAGCEGKGIPLEQFKRAQYRQNAKKYLTDKVKWPE